LVALISRWGTEVTPFFEFRSPRAITLEEGQTDRQTVEAEKLIAAFARVERA